jgi:hypothetical protein
VIIAVGALIGALYLLWENMASVKEFFGDLWADIVQGFDWLIEKIVSGAELAKNAVTDLIPGGEESVPALAAGTPSFQGGRAIVGEKGPEMVNLPRGVEVIPNNKLAAAQKSTTAAKAGGAEKPPIIKLMLNERELGQAVLEVIDKKLSVFTGIS